MTLLRAAARTMLASYFVVSGFKALKNPSELVPAAEPLVDRIVPLAKKYAPEQVADQIPDDTATLIRINGALQLLGGLALATGKGRRLGATFLAVSLVPATIAKHPFWTRDSLEERSADRAQFLKNVSLLGGVILAARDTEGRPGLAWRAHKTQQSIARSTESATKKLTRSGHDLGDQGKEIAESAMAGGTALLGAVAASTRKARKQAAKQFAVAQKSAAKTAKQAKKDAPKLAKQARKRAAEIQKDVQRNAAAAAKQARKDAPKLAKQAKQHAAEVQKKAAVAAKQARKDAPKLAKQAEQARKDAVKAAQQGAKSGSKAIEQARKDGGSALDQAIKDGSKFASQVGKDASKIAGNVADTVSDAVDAAKKSAADVTKNIHLGDN